MPAVPPSRELLDEARERRKDGIEVRKYPDQLGDFVLADSLIRKDTTGTLGYIKSHVLRGLDEVQKKIPGFSLKSRLEEQEKAAIDELPPVERRLLEGTLKTRDIRAEGEQLFQARNFDHVGFGRLLNLQQDVVRDHLQISVPKIDRMIKTSLEAGALGAKINGSGQGGCIFAYAPDRAREVCEALERLDSKPQIVNIDSGAAFDQADKEFT